MTLLEESDILLNSNDLIRRIQSKVLNSDRITPEEGLYLYEHASLSELAYLANYIRENKHGNKSFLTVIFI